MYWMMATNGGNMAKKLSRTHNTPGTSSIKLVFYSSYSYDFYTYTNPDIYTYVHMKEIVQISF